MINLFRSLQSKICLLIGLYLLFLGDLLAASAINPLHCGYEIKQDTLRSHVDFLSSDLLEGRLTGSEGERLATQYIANIFLKLGLEPAGDHGSFFQEFHFTAGVSLGANNSFAFINKKGEKKYLKLNQQWRPLSFSDTTSFEGKELIFAGYGIQTPALASLSSYDSYNGLDVKNKWVIVLNDVPQKIPQEQSHQLSQYASPRYKAFIAKEQGAKGIIFINPPNIKSKNTLIPFSSDTSLSGSGIAALSVTNTVLNDLLPMHSIKKWQDALDLGKMNALPGLSNIRLLGQIDIVKNTRYGRNVLAKLKIGGDNEPMLVVGAHADHLGRGELSGSRGRNDEKSEIHYGADDNASGVASVLEVAAKLSDLKAKDKLHGHKDVLFAAWSGEEFGVLGSAHFVQQAIKNSPNKSLRPAIDAVINLDMVGHLKDSLVLQATGSSSDWPKVIHALKRNHSIAIVTQNDPYLPTDSTSFYLHKVPTLNFFTGVDDSYHTPRDTADTLNYAGMKKISVFLTDLILSLENRTTLMHFNEVQQTHEPLDRDLTIYLGTIPDYASADVEGVKLSGVVKNSPAERAGIQSEDVIIQLAKNTIHDIYDYTFALNTLPVGKPVQLIVLREKKKIILKVIAQYR